MNARREDGPSLAYGRYALAVLFVVALFNYIDRTILSIMQVSLKQELGLSDTQLGSLTGLSFALFYTTLALPIARLADRMTRKYVLASALTLWTLMTAASSQVTGYADLLICRIGVAAGEAGCVPTTHSLISDYFPRERRAGAMGVWGLSLSMGAMLGFWLGGRLTQSLGWRDTFLVIGLSGLAMAPVVIFGLIEPKRGRFDGGSQSAAAAPPVLSAIRVLWNLRAFRYLAIGEALQAFAQIGMNTWNAPFYARIHHLPLAEIATWLALIIGLGGGCGTYFGGVIADILGRRDVGWYMRVPGIAAALTAPFALLQYFVGDPYVSLCLGIVPAIAAHAYLAPVNAISQSLVPANMRAFTSAMLVLTVNLIGIGLGPTLIGLMSDLLAPQFAEQSIRFALAIVVVPAGLAAWLFFRSASYLEAELGTLSATGSARPPSAANTPYRSGPHDECDAPSGAPHDLRRPM